jgi:alanine racemase
MRETRNFTKNIQTMFFKKKPFQTLNTITIDSKALLHNLEYIQSLNPEYSIFPTIKSNAYGHGIQEVAQILKNIPLKYVCVDSYFEALKVREVSHVPVLIMGYTLPENYAIMKLKNFAFFVYDEVSIHALGKLKKKIQIHLKIDTGMSRQGIQMENI